MSNVDEKAAVEHVQLALAERFPTISPATVKTVVDEVYAGFDGPVRDYVPLLVERISRDRLREMSSGGGLRRQLVGSDPGGG